MKNHKFIYNGFCGDRKIYLVKCIKEKGEFSTKDWENNICLCCKEVINKK